MVGWEYPPHNSGGLGVACEGLTEALALNNTQIYFTLPYQFGGAGGHMQVLSVSDPSWTTTDQAPFLAYTTAAPLPTQVDADQLHALPTSQLEQRVSEYADLVQGAAQPHNDSFEVVHAHDWMTFPAARQVAAQTGAPFVAHIHSTEFDRIPGGTGSPYIHQTEYEGVQQAKRVIAVSYYTKQLLIDKYAVDPQKIDVVHNGAPKLTTLPDPGQHHFASGRPVVVFMGRLTMQKGADYFIKVAEKVLEKLPNALFIVAGNGDMYQQLLLTTAYQALSAHVLFSGFLRGPQREQLLDRADVFVMPSLSEPFGLVAIEAAQRHTPVIVSKTAGVQEVLPSAISLDFWDVDAMSLKILELLKKPHLAQEQVQAQLSDVAKVTWEKAALQVKDVYRKAFLG